LATTEWQSITIGQNKKIQEVVAAAAKASELLNTQIRTGARRSDDRDRQFQRRQRQIFQGRPRVSPDPGAAGAVFGPRVLPGKSEIIVRADYFGVPERR